MSLEKSTITWSAKQISSMVMNGKINFDHVTQRSYVWEKARKSSLIESMFLGYPIPAIFAKRAIDHENKNNNVYYVMDGKQRLSTIAGFINNEFSLSQLKPVQYTDHSGEIQEIDVTQLYYKQLPEELQDIVKDTMFNIIFFDNLTVSEEREMFKRLNSGKPLSTKSKILASCTDIDHILTIGSHKLFEEMLSQKARDNKDQVAIIIKVWMMLNYPINEISFESKIFKQKAEEIAISKEEEQDMESLFNYIVELHSLLRFKHFLRADKKIYTEIHLISLIPFLAKAKSDNYNTDQVIQWLVSFYEVEGKTSISEEYNNNCMSKVARASSIIARHNALTESFDNYFRGDI